MSSQVKIKNNNIVHKNKVHKCIEAHGETHCKELDYEILQYKNEKFRFYPLRNKKLLKVLKSVCVKCPSECV